ncbi:MAG: hypothetical protein K2Z25_19930 [Beijerinckiaceae bacterium]|nr:hypothetical protein [Beijerinckiaceae bacterium]
MSVSRKRWSHVAQSWGGVMPAKQGGDLHPPLMKEAACRLDGQPVGMPAQADHDRAGERHEVGLISVDNAATIESIEQIPRILTAHLRTTKAGF